MRKEEAEYIGRLLFEGLKEYGTEYVAVNLGAGDQVKLDNTKPWIKCEIWSPLAELGIPVIHTDIRRFAGIDKTLDLGDLNLEQSIIDLCKGKKPMLFLCNVLEHLPPDVFKNVVAKIPEVVKNHNGMLICSVPYQYPYHADPIDNGFRPSPEELSSALEMSGDFCVSKCESVEAGSFYNEVLGMDRLKRIRVFLRPLWLFCGVKRYRERVARLAFLFKPYSVTILVANCFRMHGCD